jgi:hypothetical protein
LDPILAGLLASWWATGDKDAARVLARRLHELPSQDVADVLVKFRSAALTVPRRLRRSARPDVV